MSVTIRTAEQVAVIDAEAAECAGMGYARIRFDHQMPCDICAAPGEETTNGVAILGPRPRARAICGTCWAALAHLWRFA